MAEDAKKQNVEDETAASDSHFKITAVAKDTAAIVKDVHDVISYGKKIYSNRAVIGRRINIVSMIFGVIFTLLYVAYVFYSGLAGKLSLSFEIVSIALVALYAVVVISCIAVAARSGRVSAKSRKRVGKFLKILRYIAKLLSIAISVACLVLSIKSGSESAAAIAVDTVMIIIAIIMVIFQTIILLSGGIGGFIRWLISPVNRKVRFSSVALEWYQLAADDVKSKNKSIRIDKKYIDDAGAVLDGVLLPALGKMYIGNITTTDLTGVLESVPDELSSVGEGTLKNIFEYACGCGYISENPCDKLHFTGDISKKSVAKRAFDGAMRIFGKKADG